ncbi:TonB-dependent receptor [Microbulbifer agarilyticus]|uniref:TonB-dependent receptor n=1 Tax=Microbulbifer agarilyticus TaxID=260552 RepID=UPI001CD50B40|nr:TonB-dependent receptor [Microbulbifer agarilyticus]MCA0900808.1 TonB-dependent receptor [Microbulbifer agarilyticus]
MKKTKLSLAVLAALTMQAPGYVLAQDAESQASELKTTKVKSEAAQAESMEELTVTGGMRASEVEAINMKRNANVVAEALAAEDIGALPDQSIAESLERLTGVTGNQDNGRSNTISVRGMGGQYTLTTLNDREIVGSFGSRSVNLSLYPSGAIRRAQVYKTATSDMLEGGIGGTVNMETFKPLESDRDVRSFSVAGNSNELYQDLTFGPKYGTNIQGLFSQRITDDFAVSVGASVKDDVRHIEGVKAGNLLTGLGWTTDWNGDGLATEISPPAAVLTSKKFNDDQNAVFAAAQWQVNEDLLISADFLSANYDYEMDMAVMSFWGLSSGDPLGDPALADINEKNYVMSGLASVNSIGKWDANVLNEDETEAFGFNFDYQLTDSIRAELDLSRSTADRLYQYRTVSGKFGEGMNHFLAFDMHGGEFGLDYLGSEDAATASAHNPDTYTLDESQLTNVLNDDSLWNFSGVNWSQNTTESQLDAVKLDLTFDVALGPLQEIKTGFRRSNMTKDFSNDPETFDASVFEGINFAGLNTSVSNNPYQKLDVNGFDEFAYFNAGQILSLYGDVLPERTEDAEGLLESGSIEEDTTAFYVQANFYGEWYDGFLGARYYKTELEATGYEADYEFNVNAKNGKISMKPTGEVMPSLATNEYSGVLPTLNVNLRLIEDTVIRVGAGKAMIRPDSNEINPYLVTNNKTEWDVQLNQLSERTLGRAGNPYLTAIESTQGDVSFEWYPNRRDYYALAVFYKDLDGLYEQGAEYLPIELDGVEGEQLYLPVTSEVMADGGVVKGWEFSFRQSLGRFSPYLRGFALNGNYMDFDHGAQQDYNPRYSGQAPEDRPTELYYSPVGWINSTYNLALTYDHGQKFSTRVNLTQQDYMATRDGQDYTLRWPSKNLSVSANYKVLDNVTVFAQAANLLDEATTKGNLKSDKVGEAHPDYIWESTHRGVSWYAGVRARF